jgi:hypothetical protein
MKIATKELVEELVEKTRLNINKAIGFKKLSEQELNYKEGKDRWSILECIEHLNLYGDFYNPEIKQCIKKSQSKSSSIFKSGLMGNYFVKIISPKEQLNKMKTLKINNPIGSKLDKNVIERFINQQKEYLELIDKSKEVNLTKVKTAISITKLFKLRLGDTLRFVTAHNERHLIQAENVQKKFRSN